VALWQFKVALIPQNWIDSGGIVEELFSDEEFDQSAAWAEYCDSRLEESLSTALQKSESWHSDLTLWGDIDGDDIQLWRDHGKVESLQVRFDLRNPTLALFQSVVDIARELGLAILALEMRSIVPLDPRELLHVAAESNAARFLDDPHSFLQQLGRRVQEHYNKGAAGGAEDTCD